MGGLSEGLAWRSADHLLALHCRAELSCQRIAARLEVPVGTVMSRLHGGRAKLKKRMEEIPETDGDQGGDPLRLAVDVETGVLLQVWEESGASPYAGIVSSTPWN